MLILSALFLRKSLERKKRSRDLVKLGYRRDRERTEWNLRELGERLEVVFLGRARERQRRW